MKVEYCTECGREVHPNQCKSGICSNCNPKTRTKKHILRRLKNLYSEGI